jgi:hypothetical protein
LGGALGSAALLPESVFALDDAADMLFVTGTVITMNLD